MAIRNGTRNTGQEKGKYETSQFSSMHCFSFGVVRRETVGFTWPRDDDRAGLNTEFVMGLQGFSLLEDDFGMHQQASHRHQQGRKQPHA